MYGVDFVIVVDGSSVVVMVVGESIYGDNPVFVVVFADGVFVNFGNYNSE